MTDRRHYCFNCGEDIGRWERGCDERDDCGRPECAREGQAAYAYEREAAHEQLDRDMGWY